MADKMQKLQARLSKAVATAAKWCSTDGWPRWYGPSGMIAYTASVRAMQIAADMKQMGKDGVLDACAEALHAGGVPWRVIDNAYERVTGHPPMSSGADDENEDDDLQLPAPKAAAIHPRI
jgi:hypothetical protein